MTSLEKQLEPIKSENLSEDEEVLLFQNRIRFCHQLLRNKLDQAGHSPTKISRSADLKARQVCSNRLTLGDATVYFRRLVLCPTINFG